MNTNKPISITKAAGKLNVPVSWLREQADAGSIPCLKVAKKLLFNLAALENALAQKAAVTPLGEEDGRGPPKVRPAK